MAITTYPQSAFIHRGTPSSVSVKAPIYLLDFPSSPGGRRLLSGNPSRDVTLNKSVQIGEWMDETVENQREGFVRLLLLLFFLASSWRRFMMSDR